MPATLAYRASAELIRKRLRQARSIMVASEDKLLQAEELALQVRKIVESVAFACLSAAEYRNGVVAADQRTKDADKLLSWLSAKAMLKLPQAQDIHVLSDGEFKFEFRGAQARDLKLGDLKAAYGRASELIHERHPEALDQAAIAAEFAALSADAQALDGWLWTHMMVFKDEAILIQMTSPDDASFLTEFRRLSDLPAGYTADPS